MENEIRKTENKEQLGKVVKTAWPAVFESFFISLAGMIDTLMVSGIGADAVASVGLTTQPKFLGLALFIAINVAVAAIVARRKGENSRRKANEVLGEALVLVAALGVVMSILFVAGADWIIELCGSGEDTHDGAVLYFRIIMGGMMFNIFSMVINAAQRGAGNTRIAMYTNTISSVVNVVGNYLLIGGNMGFPKLGIQGAALATVFGTAVACTISIFSLFRKDSFLSMPLILREKLWQKFGEVKTIFRLASSAFVEQVLMRIGFMSTAVMAADMGTAAMAAHQVGMNALSLSFSMGDGMQAAAVTLIGQSLGENNKPKAKKYGMLCQKIGLMLAALMSLFYFFFGETLYRLFFQEEHIVSIGIDITRIVMVIVLFQISQVIFTGCLRGAGDVAYTMMSSCVSVTFVRTIASYVFCYICGWGINGIWWGIVADQFCRLAFNSLRFKSGKWMEIKI
ncbi:MAG: MATE family efflux transporter [Clostridiales bacterium]|nr:MATE family efflux transporter [Clostridiales bacterium]